MLKRKENYTSFEYMIFTITTKYKLIRVINIYRPDYPKKHKVNSSTFLKEFSKLLDEITSLPGILVITGDFNIHMESLDNKYTIELADMFELNQLVTKPTHQNGGLIDLVITSDNSSVQDISIHEDGVGSDHHPIRFKVACQLHSNINVKEIRIRNFSKLNLNKIKEDFIRSPILSRPSGDANRMVQSYQDVLTEIMDKHCPIKK